MRTALVLLALAAAEAAKTRHLTMHGLSRMQQILSSHELLAARGDESEAPPAPAPSSSLSDVTFNKRLVVNATVNAANMVARNLTVMGDASATVLTASRVRATMLSADVVEAGILRSPTGTITIDGNLALDGGLRADPDDAAARGGATSFLATEVIVNGVRQWRLLEHDDFEGEDENAALRGWTPGATRTACGGLDHALGGYCAPVPVSGTFNKTFSALPTHSQLRLKARVHFLDDWRGETAFARVDGKYVWSDAAGTASVGGVAAAEARAPGINVCGADTADRKLSAPVDVIVKHSGPEATVAFGSTLDADSDPCERSWAVDDVVIYVR
jgi:hypothetical protein